MLNLRKRRQKILPSASLSIPLALTPQSARSTTPLIPLFVVFFVFGAFSAKADDESILGPAYSDFALTLSSGHRWEAVGPFFYSQTTESQDQLAVPPLFCYTRELEADWREWEFLYPIIDYRRFGSEWRLHFAQMLSFSGGLTQQEQRTRQFTLFPFYFQQRSDDPALRYTALVPFYGHLKNRLFRDEATFVMLPLYLETRKKDVITDNYLFPVFHRRHGDHLTGWQVWPLAGQERKAPTVRTNRLDELETVGGYDRLFAAWPFFFQDELGLGTTNVVERLTLVPFYTRMRSPARDETNYGWPLGFMQIEDRQKKFSERSLFWPLFVSARGSKVETRVFPFFSHAKSTNLESRFYVWPVYSWHDQKVAAFDRQRTRILFFLYSDILARKTDGGVDLHRADGWPLFAYRHEKNGNRRLQVFAPLEPLFPNNRAILREYSQVWSVWRWEKNGKTGTASQAVLWNLYRRETAGRNKNCSLLFGLFRYQSTAEGTSWRVCGLPLNHKRTQPGAPRS
jgi:hypothetical protein